jgi:hypothetical protein
MEQTSTSAYDQLCRLLQARVLVFSLHQLQSTPHPRHLRRLQYTLSYLMTMKMTQTATPTRQGTLRSRSSLRTMSVRTSPLVSRRVSVTPSTTAEPKVAMATTVMAAAETMVTVSAVLRVRWSDLDMQRRLATEAVTHILSRRGSVIKNLREPGPKLNRLSRRLMKKKLRLFWPVKGERGDGRS